MITDEQLAKTLYDVYCKAVGGKSYDNKPLPTWEEFSTDKKKTTQSAGWLVVAKTAKDTLSTTAIKTQLKPI